ncbi:type II secretion system F family protein [Spiractinospora alimapuensis]|uniref:type II secretion system F family protein n=1 Tax=Spiractinospora alimapuensis TaxID=2820884 RepID=UPI001F41E389|nr:type II secretion system F family protein [Spiractinospora alimapuensis]
MSDLFTVTGPYLIAATVVVGVALALWAGREFYAAARQRRVIAARSALAEVERRATTPLARFDSLVRSTEAGRWLERRIQRSGVDLRAGTAVAGIVGGSVLAVVVVWQVLAPVLGILAIAAVSGTFFAYLRQQESRRREEFTAQLPDLARVLSNATSAGLALPTAIDMASEELADPAGAELRHMANSLKLGMPFEKALEDLRTRMPSREIGVLASTLFVASRSGGSLVTALRNISETLENRKETRREVRTILGETTVTSWALVVFFVAALFGVNLVFPGVLETMTTQMPGQLLLGGSMALTVVGIALIRSVTRIKF